MTDFTQIFTEFSELVGYRNENEITLTPNLNNSGSGLFVNDLAGISLQIIEKSGYLKSDLTPEKTVSEYLEMIYNAELQKIINDFLFKMQDKLKSPALKYQDYSNDFENAELSEQNKYFVGLLFNLENGYNLNATIEKIALKLKEAQNLQLYFYDLQKEVALEIVNFDYTNAKDLQSIVTDLILKYKDENSKNKSYVLGYYEFDSNNPLSEKSLNETNQAYRIDFNNHAKDLNLRSIKIESEKWNFNTSTGVYDLPDFLPEDYNCDSYSTFDVKLNIECDYTEILIKNKTRFAEILQYSLAKRIISDCLFSNEFNTVTESNRKNWNNMLIFFNNQINGYEFIDEHGNSGKKNGMLDFLMRYFEGIDINCFPKRRKLVLS